MARVDAQVDQGALVADPLRGNAGQDSLPSFSCATFNVEASHSYLAAPFGADNVAIEPVFGFDDGPTEGTVLFPNHSAARVEIILLERESKSRPAWITVRSERSRCRTLNGITLGTDLLSLERMNGQPFRLAGFRNAISGQVRSWAGGRLELANTPRCALQIYLYPARRP